MDVVPRGTGYRRRHFAFVATDGLACSPVISMAYARLQGMGFANRGRSYALESLLADWLPTINPEFP
jgi:hypothetical protein